MSSFSGDKLHEAAISEGLFLPPFVCDQVVAAIDSGRHIVLTGPPGTGKTTLAALAAEAGRKAMMCTGILPTTATSEWSTYDTIGGLQPTPDGLLYRPGMFIEAIMEGKWLVIDEMNRSNFDRAFGQLFTVLSGSAVVLPYRRISQGRPVSIVPAGVTPPSNTDPIRLPATWRIIGTLNSFDKHLLFDMSYALMRRFAFIEVGCPPDEVYRKVLGDTEGDLAPMLRLRRFTELGPAVFADSAKYVRRRRLDGVSGSRLRYEVFYAYLLPQFGSLDEDQAYELIDATCELMDPQEQDEVRRVAPALLDLPYMS